MADAPAREISAISDMATMSEAKTLTEEDVIVSPGSRRALLLNGLMSLAFASAVILLQTGQGKFAAGRTTSKATPGTRNILNGESLPGTGTPDARRAATVTASGLPPAPVITWSGPKNRSAIGMASNSMVKGGATFGFMKSSTAPLSTVPQWSAGRAQGIQPPVQRPMADLPLQTKKGLAVTLNFVTYKKSAVEKCTGSCLVPFSTAAGQPFTARITDLSHRDILLVARGAVNIEGHVVTAASRQIFDLAAVRVNSPFDELERLSTVKKVPRP